MDLTPEQKARVQIDTMLDKAGWEVQSVSSANVHAKQGIAIREFPLETGHGFADYLPYVEGKAAGVIEAKREGTTLSGVEMQSDKYKHGLPAPLPAWFRPLPFCYQSTGIETCFTNDFDPNPRSRDIFHFHRPETLFQWLKEEPPAKSERSKDGKAAYGHPPTLRAMLKLMPPLVEKGIWPAQITALQNLEKSLGQNRPVP